MKKSRGLSAIFLAASWAFSSSSALAQQKGQIEKDEIWKSSVDEDHCAWWRPSDVAAIDVFTYFHPLQTKWIDRKGQMILVEAGDIVLGLKGVLVAVLRQSGEKVFLKSDPIGPKQAEIDNAINKYMDIMKDMRTACLNDLLRPPTLQQ